MGITEIADVLLKLVVVAAILAIGWLFIRRKPPEPEEHEPPTPTEPVVTPLGVDVRCSVYPQEWPHGKFCPDCFPEGSALCFVGLYDDNDPSDPIKPALFKWTIFGPFSPYPVYQITVDSKNNACWDGSGFVGGCCSDPNPIKPYRVVCQIQLTNGTWLNPVEKTIYAVPQRVWKEV